MSKIRILKFAGLFVTLIISGCSVSPSADKPDFASVFASPGKLYDGFKNPPVSAEPFARWSWDVKGPTKKEILNRLDSFKKAGIGGDIMGFDGIGQE